MAKKLRSPPSSLEEKIGQRASILGFNLTNISEENHLLIMPNKNAELPE
jgi:hypothetical protein